VLSARGQAQNTPSDTVIATVNGTSVTEGDLEFLYLARAVDDELRASVRDRFLEEFIDRVLLRQFLDKKKVVPSETLVTERVQRMEKLITREGLDFDETLESLGYTRASFREAAALPLAWRMHARTVINNVAIAKYWKAHQAKFDGTEVRASQIVKRVPKEATTEQTAAIKQHLTELRSKIEAGDVTFADTAKAESDSPSGRDGGNIGQFVYRGKMPIELTSVAFRLKVGELSEPFQTRFGMHLLTVTEIVPGDLSLEDARAEIFDTLSQAVQKRLITELRKTANIRKVAGN
jgi:peptidyl-prolyl cis-trans isomerase C